MGSYQGAPFPAWLKFTICIGFDLFDFTVGRLLLGVSLISDVATAVVLFVLWGPMGLFALWEMVDVTEQIDGFVPTSTLIAIAAHRRSVAT